jgi:hypothetical protein
MQDEVPLSQARRVKGRAVPWPEAPYRNVVIHQVYSELVLGASSRHELNVRILPRWRCSKAAGWRWPRKLLWLRCHPRRCHARLIRLMWREHWASLAVQEGSVVIILHTDIRWWHRSIAAGHKRLRWPPEGRWTSRSAAAVLVVLMLAADELMSAVRIFGLVKSIADPTTCSPDHEVEAWVIWQASARRF